MLIFNVADIVMSESTAICLTRLVILEPLSQYHAGPLLMGVDLKGP